MSAPHSPQNESTAEVEWRCFFCEEVFKDPAEAAVHFGANQECDPGCKIGQLTGEERSLLKSLREAEGLIRELRQEMEVQATESYGHSVLKAEIRRLFGDESPRQALDQLKSKLEVSDAELAALRVLAPMATFIARRQVCGVGSWYDETPEESAAANAFVSSPSLDSVAPVLMTAEDVVELRSWRELARASSLPIEPDGSKANPNVLSSRWPKTVAEVARLIQQSGECQGAANER